MLYAKNRNQPRFKFKKVGWFEAASLFFANKDQVNIVWKFTKYVFMVLSKFGIYTLPVTIPDDFFDAAPFLNFLTIGDDVLAVFGVIMVIWITVYRKGLNSQLREEMYERYTQMAYQ